MDRGGGRIGILAWGGALETCPTVLRSGRKRMATKRQDIKFLSVGELRLDPRNPRLPEGAERWSQNEILVHLKETAALDELAHSLVAEGFFINEPLTVMEDPKLKGFVALEGNRRVATLMILTNQPDADGESFFDLEPTSAQQRRLSEVPCIAVDSRDEVDSFVGFRHIGGLKTWSPEAKARWIGVEVEKEARKSSTANPFLVVGRRVGLGTPSIRSSFIALHVLRTARDEGSVKIDGVLDPRAQRFGVWLRCMNSPEIREFMGLNLVGGDDYKTIRRAISKINPTKVGEVIRDLLPREGNPAALRDSRDVTTYGRILANERARKVLRAKHDLELARQVIEDLELAVKLRKQFNRLEILRQELARVDVTADLTEAVEDIWSVAKQMRAIVRAASDE